MMNKSAALPEHGAGLLEEACLFQTTQTETRGVGLNRTTTSKLVVKVFTSIEAVGRAEWNRLSGDAVTRSYDYLRAVEAAQIEGMKHYYLRVCDDAGAAVAQVPAYVVVTDFGQLLPRFLRPLLLVRSWWPDFLTARITECATPLFAGLAVSPNEVVSDNSVVLELERAMTLLAKSEKSRLIVFRDFYERERDALEILKARGYKCVNNLPLARIRVTWNSYQAYLDSMRSRYRKDLRRRLKKAASLGQSVRVRDTFASDAEQWARQAGVIYCQAAGFKRETVNADYYREMEQRLGENCKLLVVEREGRAEAHGMVIFDRQNAVATFFGRESGPASGEWFLLMNEVVRMGIERGCRFIDLGLGSYEAKALVGAEEERLFVFTRCTQPLLNALIRLIPDLMKRSAPRRNRPFRKF